MTAQRPQLRRKQPSVLRDGFVVSHPADGGRRVIELDPQGAERRVIPLPR
jgi:hypothetical protein